MVIFFYKKQIPNSLPNIYCVKMNTHFRYFKKNIKKISHSVYVISNLFVHLHRTCK
jgi:hypothetical protein